MTAQKIKLTVAQHFGITVKQLDSRDRTERIAWPRQIAMQLTRHWRASKGETRASGRLTGLFQTAAEFKRDPGSVLYAIDCVRDRTHIYAKDRADHGQILQKLGL